MSVPEMHLGVSRVMMQGCGPMGLSVQRVVRSVQGGGSEVRRGILHHAILSEAELYEKESEHLELHINNVFSYNQK